jgi:hypothetical protein
MSDQLLDDYTNKCIELRRAKQEINELEFRLDAMKRSMDRANDMALKKIREVSQLEVQLQRQKRRSFFGLFS